MRNAAAFLATWGAWGPSPHEDVFAALNARSSVETDPETLITIRTGLWDCHCARPEMVEAALAGLRATNERAQDFGLSSIALVGKNGRNFDRASRERMERAVEPFVSSADPGMRREALQAWSATAVESPELVRTRVIGFTRDPDALVRITALHLLQGDTSAEAISALLARLDDTEIAEVRTRPGQPGSKLYPVADAALRTLAVVSIKATPHDPFVVKLPPGAAEPAALAAEVARARAWANTHARELKLSR